MENRLYPSFTMLPFFYFQCFLLLAVPLLIHHMGAHSLNYHYSWCWLGRGKYASWRLWNAWCQYSPAPNPTIRNNQHAKHYSLTSLKGELYFPNARFRNSALHNIGGLPCLSRMAWRYQLLPTNAGENFCRKLMNMVNLGWAILYCTAR